ncbi:alanyl-tRNA editing protein [Azospirillum sp. YIM B02556]|uniref:Alanyl-tRNA editing protein n=1 Tax=Azospirillum endophyticum TaxID=2800326 RepID=A0ABS1F4Y7_9PROT|nr:alanyl-tRNA editing protein [Azospirillum endophyticum]MBK1838484.1 alanyl-tRNA editing protein [Azospirillum endophyticum]
MTRKLFWDDPYRTRLDTRIAAVDGDEVALEATIFYALSGGQESDAGTIGRFDVLEARKDGREIRYRLAPGHGLVPGDAVAVAIDWQRRYRLMRLHFAAEIVLELVMHRLPGIRKVGAHIAADKARIDFAWDEPLTPLLPELAERAMTIVVADTVILSGFSDEAAERRFWEIPGLARVPCGGTHLRRAGEIGALTLKRRNTGKGKERIEIALVDA